MAARPLALFALLLPLWRAPVAAAAARAPAAMTPAQERRLAASILVQAWEEWGVAGGDLREELLIPLTAADPTQALARVRGTTPLLVLVRCLEIAVSQGSPEARGFLEWAASLVAVLPDPTMQAAALRARIGAAARALRDPRGKDLLERAMQRVDALRLDAGGSAGTIRGLEAGAVRDLVRVLSVDDPAAALTLASRIPDPDSRAQVWRHGLATIARTDPARAILEMDALNYAPGGYAIGETEWARAALGVVAIIALHDRERAEALAARIPLPLQPEDATAICRYLPPARAAPVLQAALDRLAAGRQSDFARLSGLLRLAESMPSAAGRRRACNLAIETYLSGYRDPSDLAAIALALARDDPKAARDLLDEEFAVGRSGGTRAALEGGVALGYAAIDPARAVEIARGIPPNERGDRFEALLKIARYLLTPPVGRARVPARRWALGRSHISSSNRLTWGEFPLDQPEVSLWW